MRKGKVICDGCRRAKERASKRLQRKFDRQADIEDKRWGDVVVEEEDASAVWAEGEKKK